MAGIIGYGAYVPRNRIKVEEIAKVWGADAPSYKKGLMLREKSVPSPDQDVITMSVEATRHALTRCGIDPQKIGAVYIGSESHPYAVKPSGTVVAEAIGATPDCHCVDFEFACKAGSEAMFVCMGLVDAGAIEYGLAIGADTSQGAPGDALEYTASAGGAAYLVGPAAEALAVFEGSFSYVTDTPDFWRRAYQHYPSHGGRFTGQPAYFKHTTAAAQGLMQVIPSTGEWVAQRIGWPDYQPAHVYRPHINVKFGVYYLAFALEYAGDNLATALVGYNAGPGNARFWRAVAGDDEDLFLETITISQPQRYVRGVLQQYAVYRRLYGQ